MERSIGGRVLRLAEGDITDLAVDAIVNAANSQLQLGAGVAGAIRRKGGPAIQRGCNAIGFCPVGGAVITTGGRLPAKVVIHAVGPHGSDLDADQKLVAAVRSSLEVAADNGLESIALPAISTGIFGFPLDAAARIILHTARDFLQHAERAPREVIICLYGQAAYDTFAAELQRQAAE